MKRCDVCKKQIWPWRKSQAMKRVEVDTTKQIDPQSIEQIKGDKVHVHEKCMEMVM